MTIMSYPITYEATVLKPRHTYASKEAFGEWIVVHIEDVDPGDAPITLSWHKGDDQRMTLQAPENEPFVARYYDGSHWVPIITSDGGPTEYASAETLWPLRMKDHSVVTTPFRPEPRTLMGALTDNASVDLKRFADSRAITQLKQLGADQIKALDETSFRGTSKSTRREAESLALADAMDMISIEGRLYRRCLNEPMLQYSTAWMKKDEAVVFVTDEFPDKIQSGGIFRIDRFDDLIDQLTRNEGLKVTLLADGLEVIEPGTFSLDDEAWTISRIARRFLDNMHPWTKEADFDSEVPLYYSLRDALRAHDSDPSHENIRELVRTMQAFAPFADETFSQQLQSAFQRWDDRPIVFSTYEV